MKSFRSFVLSTFLFLSVACLAAKSNQKYMLPDVPPAQQREYINNLLTEAKTRMDSHDYQSAQSLLTERCALLDLFYEKHGIATADSQRTGYEYITIVPKLYCNLRIGRVGDNLQEIAHLREQYLKLFNAQHPQDDLLETEVAETYFRMGNIGMAIETAEKLILRLRKDSEHTSVAYHKVYYRLMAYYKSIGRKDTPFFEEYYEPENEVSDTWKLYSYLNNDSMPFPQKMTNLVENIAKLIAEDDYSEARNVIRLGVSLLNKQFPLSGRNADAEKEHSYNLLTTQLMNLKSKTYRYCQYPNSDAEDCLLETYNMNKRMFGESSSEVVDISEILGEYYSDVEENNEEGLKYYHEAYNILKNTGGHRKGQLIDIMGTMMQCYADMDKPNAVANFAKELITTIKDMVVTSFGVSSSAERAALWDKYNHWLLVDIPKLALKFEGRVELGAELYDIALFSKGLLMTSDDAMTELVMKKGSPELKQEGRILHELRLQLHEQLTSSKLTDTQKVEETRRKIEEVEHSLLAKVKELGDWQHALNTGWRDIQKHLKKGETAIEFIEYGLNTWEEGAIIALVLSADSYCPIMRKLCRSKDLVYTEDFRICWDAEFFKKYWSKLESDLTYTTTIYFSPAGVLNVIPIEYCPIDDSLHSLFDKYDMYRLTSTRKILERGRSKNISSAYVYGGIDYTPDLNKIKAANVALINEGIIPEGTSGLSKNLTIDTSRYHSNGIKNQYSWMGIHTATLSSTALLSDFLNMMGCDVHSFNNYRATEECFKSMSKKPIDALIANTHGFTFDASNVNCNKYSFTYKDKINNVSKSEMAMTLSGLLMSGASMAFSPNCDREGLEDGIITAAEIAQLNLRNVQLVHLSACETGLGEITPEGVLGLQRGFKRAGVRSIINTLAPAYTYVITYFDTTFYRNLFYDKDGRKRKKQSIHEAFYSSVKKVREIHKNTKYWCVNVLIDALD